MSKTAQDFKVGRDKDKNVADWYDEGIRIIVKVVRSSHFCVYLGIPSTHPAAGHDYNDVPIDCHGGLTFGNKGDDYLPEGFYWYGYDYAHSGDATDYSASERDHFWTLEEVKKDTWEPIYSLNKFMKIAEKIAHPKAKG